MRRLIWSVGVFLLTYWAVTNIIEGLSGVFGEPGGTIALFVLLAGLLALRWLGRRWEYSRPWLWWPLWGLPVALVRLVYTWRATCEGLGLSVPAKRFSQFGMAPSASGRGGGVIVKGEPMKLIAPHRVGLRVTRQSLVVRVRMHPGQAPGAWENAAEAFAHQWRVHRVRAVSERPGFVTLTGLGFDPLRYVRPVKAVPAGDGGWLVTRTMRLKWWLAGWIYGLRLSRSTRSQGRPAQVLRPSTSEPTMPSVPSTESAQALPESAAQSGSRVVVPGILAVDAGVREDGSAWVIDLKARPHWLVTGATQSGKSTLTVRVISQLAARPVCLVGIDVKGGMELGPFEARLSGLATSRKEAAAALEILVGVLMVRTMTCREHGVRNVWDLPVQVRPQPIVVVVDEVAELFLYADKEGKDEAGRCVTALVRLGQLGAALGIHLWVSGQRFGSDLGPGATLLRAQLAGRVCHRVADAETASMTLAGLPAGAVAEAQGIGADLPGVAVAGDDSGAWFMARSRYTPMQDAVWTSRLFAELGEPLPQVVKAIEHARMSGGAW